MRDEKRTRIALLLMILGNTAQRLYVRCVVRFFGRLPRNSAGILPYSKGFLGNMTALCGVAQGKRCINMQINFLS